MSKIKAPDKIEQLPLAIIQNMIALATSGFGLVVALAWNELIRTSISHYLTPIFGEGGGIVSLLVYALTVTVLAVLVTMQLSKVEKRLKKANEDENETKK
jgi:hypothetical protein